MSVVGHISFFFVFFIIVSYICFCYFWTFEHHCLFECFSMFFWDFPAFPSGWLHRPCCATEPNLFLGQYTFQGHPIQDWKTQTSACIPQPGLSLLRTCLVPLAVPTFPFRVPITAPAGPSIAPPTCEASFCHRPSCFLLQLHRFCLPCVMKFLLEEKSWIPGLCRLLSQLHQAL